MGIEIVTMLEEVMDKTLPLVDPDNGRPLTLLPVLEMYVLSIIPKVGAFLSAGALREQCVLEAIWTMDICLNPMKAST